MFVVCIMVIDVLFMFYWVVVFVVVIGLIDLLLDVMYGDYINFCVVVWNWIFFLFDVVFLVFGFLVVLVVCCGDLIWCFYVIVFFVLMMIVGGMVVVYWLFLFEFNLSWFLLNLVFFIWLLFFLGKLM